ncbi:iron-siderophore ABC transporter substrate-binding protein [Kineosporia sp. J2-2]|uniref:Iron-siderophore ABC transporter substrate-binding protein n=1 Tax=Kineosporia corallincola TaxID=2835133 RepID=A0ABS5TN41_9ACTN|nr:iron-siderophore ABC transporter substrate-binding protein [Kineosporia corallincola]MBT0772522.1 iron-siderophore ABC transporter substrate-binding protein [Kineosporia corallincola]
MRTRHRTGAAALLAATALLLAACGSGSAGEDDAGGAASGAGFEAVTIEHALGEATITEKPERIVTLGQGSTETAIALGTVPVGIEEYPWGSDDTGYLPWVYEAVKEKGAQLPTQFTGNEELDVEAIVELEPDLILAPWSGVTQEQYDVLKDIAPTVAYPELPWTITWDEQIRTIGRAMGQTDDAEQLITGIEKQLSESARDEYEDITFSYVYNTGPGTLGVFYPGEQRVAMVSALGLTVDPVVDTLGEWEVEGTDSAAIGLENADKLKDSDLIFTFYSDEANREEIEAQKLYQQIPAIARGSVVAPTEQPFVTASSIINPLTVPWTLERFTPLIDEAVAKLDR